MAKSSLSALEKLLTPHGNLNNPIPPGATFATLLTQDEIEKIEAFSKLPYPPLVKGNPGCSFDPESRTLTATTWGKAVLTREGLRIKPAWRMSEDKVLVSVDVDHQDFEDTPVTLERILASMPKVLEGIILELNLDKVTAALKKSAKTGQSHSVGVVEGSLPGQGQDAYLDLTFRSGQEAGTLRDDGSMDFRERTALHSVAEGEILGELYPAVPGTVGQDVFGQPVHPETPRDLKITIGPGVESVPGDEGSFIYKATQTGVVRFRDGKLDISELLKIEGDVDYNTGNIHAKHGSIHIAGDIKSGFKVESAGDVIVDGVVEKADITAGGLVIAGGVIMDGTNKIEANDDVTAHFFHNAIVEAGGDVSADQDISHCNITAGGKVEVLGGKGIISGGHIISASDIHASIIGNKSCVETIVEIRPASTMGDRVEAARKELEEELHGLDRAIGEGKDLSAIMSEPEEDRRILAELFRVRARIQADIRDINESNEALLQEAQQDLAAKRIKADQRAYCGTRVIIGGKEHTLKKDMESPSYSLDLESQQIAFG